MAQNLITAIARRGNTLEWTTLKSSKEGIEVVDRGTAEIAAEGDGSAAFAAALKASCGKLPGTLCAAVTSERALMRVVDLPSVDPAEMAGMVELQVDKFSPFPVEHMAVTFEPLARKDTSSRVLIAAVQKELIDEVGAAYQQAGLFPHWIDVDVMGWWFLLVEAGEVPAAGRRIMLILDAGSAELIICDDGVPLVIRSLGAPAGLSEDEYFGELADEIGYTLTALEAERGAVADQKITIWHRPDTDQPPKLDVPGVSAGGRSALISRLRDVCEAQIEQRSLDDLPTLTEGLAKRAFQRRGQVLDLAPREWLIAEQARKTSKTLLLASAVFLVVWALGVGVFFGGLQFERKRLASVKKEVELLEAPAAEVRDLNGKIREFEAYSDRSHSALEALLAVTEALPDDVDLTSFTYKKADSINVRGISDAADAVYDFFESLEQSEFFERITPGDVRNKMVANMQKSEFSVTADLPGKEEQKL